MGKVSKRKYMLYLVAVAVIALAAILILSLNSTLSKNIGIPNFSGECNIGTHLDIFQGNSCLNITTGYPNGTYWGTVTSFTFNSITDSNAHFTPGSLVGMAINPYVGIATYEGNGNWTSSGRTVQGTGDDLWWNIVGNSGTTIYVNTTQGGTLNGNTSDGQTYRVLGYFSLHQVNNRWYFFDPFGNAYFPKALSLVAYSGTAPDTIPYTALYLATEGGTHYSSNLASESMDPYNGYVLVNSSGVTLKKVGDTIYIGNSRPFDDTYLLTWQNGAGGHITWYYYNSSSGWREINGNGNPGFASQLNNGAYSMDTGAFYAPNNQGLYGGSSDQSNLVNWWEYYDVGIPPQWVPTTIAGVDNTPRYYIKGVVTTAFSTPPILRQIFDAPSYTSYVLENMHSNTQFPGINWIEDIKSQMLSWGWNAAGYDSTNYWWYSGLSENNRLPMFTYGLNFYQTLLTQGPYLVKDGLTGVDNSYCGEQGYEYPGQIPDPFDINYPLALQYWIGKNNPGVTQDRTNPWAYAMVSGEPDFLYGLTDISQVNMGFAIAGDNPHETSSGDGSYSDPRLYEKYALRDMLRYEYRSSGDPVPQYTIGTANAITYDNSFDNSGQNATYDSEALTKLNNAWGTHYTTWGTSSGTILNGTNAYGTGTGFMDENGQHILPASGNCGDITYISWSYTNKPAIGSDLNNFTQLFTKKLFSDLNGQLRKHIGSTPLVAILYVPPTIVANAVSNYSDALWVSSNVSYTQQIYNAYLKPVIYADYLSATPDSPNNFGGVITSLTYNSSNQQTTVTWRGKPLESNYASFWNVEFRGENQPNDTYITFQNSSCDYYYAFHGPYRTDGTALI
jgi:hypothetical protein